MLMKYLTEAETNQLLHEHLQTLLVDKGSVSNRSELPEQADNFDSYLLEDEDLIVFAYHKKKTSGELDEEPVEENNEEPIEESNEELNEGDNEEPIEELNEEPNEELNEEPEEPIEEEDDELHCIHDEYKLVWLPLTFFVDMRLYETVEGVNEKIEAVGNYLATVMAGKAETNHTHTKEQITNFIHDHPASEISGLQTLLDAKADANVILSNGAESSELPSTNSSPITSLLQTIRNNLKHLFKNKVDKAISITHDDLLVKISNYTLVPSQKYLISDFKTIYKQPVTNETLEGEEEPLVVTAMSTNQLEPIAFSPSNPYDIIYYDVAKNNSAKYEWAVADDKGQIYRRITKNGNDLQYDTRAVKFRRWAVNIASHTEYNAGTTYNRLNTVVYNNAIWASNRNGNIGNTPGASNNEIWWSRLGTTTGVDRFFIPNNSSNPWYMMVIDSADGIPLYVNTNDYQDFYTFDNGSGENQIDTVNVRDNKIDKYVTSNKHNLNNSVFIGNNFSSNTIGNNFYSNTIGNNFYSNTIGNYFYMGMYLTEPL